MAAETALKNPSIDVMEEDQAKINRFACLIGKRNDLETELKDLKRQIENIEEASGELILSDDYDFEDLDSGDKPKEASSVLHFKIGKIFVPVSKDDCETSLEKKKKELEGKISNLKPSLSQIQDELSSLKAKLYAKFGDNIGLDEAPTDD